MSKGTSPPEGAASPDENRPTPSSLEQVREMLFGGHYRDLERRMARLDAHLAAQLNEQRNETHRRFEVLESHLRSESEALVARFESERGTHSDALGALSREVRDARAALEQRSARVEESLARAQRELRQQILDQAKSFIAEVAQMRHELDALAERSPSTRDELSGVDAHTTHH